MHADSNFNGNIQDGEGPATQCSVDDPVEAGSRTHALLDENRHLLRGRERVSESDELAEESKSGVIPALSQSSWGGSKGGVGKSWFPKEAKALSRALRASGSKALMQAAMSAI